VRERLLDAATALCSARGFGEVGLREIARRAGVTPAMVSYYFGDKRGLYEAMFERVFQRIAATLAEVGAGSGADGDPLARFVRFYVATLAREPWIPPLLVREVISGDAAFRARFAERFPARLLPLFFALVRREQTEGRLRADLDPGFTLLSLVGLCVMPFLARPIVGPLLGLRLEDEAERARLADHVVRLLEEGLRPREPAR
jgi:AcrR family transcriptional regulator